MGSVYAYDGNSGKTKAYDSNTGFAFDGSGQHPGYHSRTPPFDEPQGGYQTWQSPISQPPVSEPRTYQYPEGGDGFELFLKAVLFLIVAAVGLAVVGAVLAAVAAVVALVLEGAIIATALGASYYLLFYATKGSLIALSWLLSRRLWGESSPRRAKFVGWLGLRGRSMVPYNLKNLWEKDPKDLAIWSGLIGLAYLAVGGVVIELLGAHCYWEEWCTFGLF